MLKWNKKCRFFNEKYACDTLGSENYENCDECKFSQEYSKKVLIIKLGAIGDVLRTTCILPALKRKYGESIMIYWLTNPESADILKNNPLIDKVLLYNLENILRIQQEKFDLLFALEIDTPSTLIANLVKTNEKFGYLFNDGITSCYNSGAEDYLKTAFLNYEKLKNRNSYQELITKACELGNYYKKEKPIFNLNKKHFDFAEKFKIKNSLNTDKKIIGINIGSSSRWASKFWDNEKILELIIKLKQSNFEVIVLAGPNEVDKQKELINNLNQTGIFLPFNDPHNTFDEFASVINVCDLIICGDSLVLHLSSALGKKIIALFFSTPPWEIENYSGISKITSPLLEKYFFVNQYIKELSDSISVDEVLNMLNNHQNL